MDNARLPCRDGGIGRRSGFKIRRRKAWGFESPSRHHHRALQRICLSPGRRSGSRRVRGEILDHPQAQWQILLRCLLGARQFAAAFLALRVTFPASPQLALLVRRCADCAHGTFCCARTPTTRCCGSESAPLRMLDRSARPEWRTLRKKQINVLVN